MKRIEDIKNFDDIDTYYEISSMVEEIFEDRVEAHKHLVTANEEIERLNNIINELEKWLINKINYIKELKEPKKSIKPYGEELHLYDRTISSYTYALEKLKELKENK